MDTLTLPKKGLSRNEIMKQIKLFGKADPDYKHQKTWSLVYYLGEEHTKLLKDAYYEYFSANGLNPAVFKSLKRFENEVIRMTANFLNGDKNTVGVMTAGGTESCMLAVKTYRDYGRAVKGIKKPEMILPVTAHVAWEKGAHFFGVKAVHAPLDKDFRVDVKALKKLINKNTVMILQSAPEYPHGFIEPIDEVGAIALEKKIPLHVDACVGGYIVPFIEKLGYEIPPWDFRVPGVTSMSADTHKYGFSAKGASTIIYRNMDIMKHQFFVYENWPGGIFASPALLGTRPGGAYAAAWAAMMSMGEEGYLKNARETMDTTEKLVKGINAIPELEVLGEPKTSIFAYRSIDKKVNIYAVADQMENRGWQIDRLQRPEALHAMVTPLHSDVIKSYLTDLKQSVAHVKKHPELANQGGAAMYGLIANLPMRGMIRKNVLDMFSAMYGPDAKMITTSEGEEMNLEGGDDTDTSTGNRIAKKVAMRYLKIRNQMKR